MSTLSHANSRTNVTQRHRTTIKRGAVFGPQVCIHVPFSKVHKLGEFRQDHVHACGVCVIMSARRGRRFGLGVFFKSVPLLRHTFQAHFLHTGPNFQPPPESINLYVVCDQHSLGRIYDKAIKRRLVFLLPRGSRKRQSAG